MRDWTVEKSEALKRMTPTLKAALADYLATEGDAEGLYLLISGAMSLGFDMGIEAVCNEVMRVNGVKPAKLPRAH